MLRFNTLTLMVLIFLMSCSASNHDSKQLKNNVISEKQINKNIWFIKTGASGNGKSISNPIGSLALLESMSKKGDSIFVLASDFPLQGGIKLKDNQRLLGLHDQKNKPVISNTDGLSNNGIGVVLANNNQISNIRIENSHASGIYGRNISSVQIDDVEVDGANRSESFLKVTYPTLPGSLPHAGMVFIHTDQPGQIKITGSKVMNTAGFGILSVTSNSVESLLSVNQTHIEGGTKIGFFDVGIAVLSQGSSAKALLDVFDSEVQGRMTRNGRNIMMVASGGAKIDAHVEQFLSGPTGQDGIVAAVMQSPSEIDLYIGDSIIEGAGQMNIEGTLVNLTPVDNMQDHKGRVSIEINGSTIRDAGAVSGFEDVAANVWLGGSQFLDDLAPAKGSYSLKIMNSRIEGAGRTGFEFGDLEILASGQNEMSFYDVVLRNNTIIDNGQADIMLHVPDAHIDARQNCWGSSEGSYKGLSDQRVVISKPASINQIDFNEPLNCSDEKN